MTCRVSIAAAFLSLLITAALTPCAQAAAQQVAGSAVDTSWILIDGARLQYLDFGGKGIP